MSDKESSGLFDDNSNDLNDLESSGLFDNNTTMETRSLDGGRTSLNRYTRILRENLNNEEK
ncbi:hypothetical protein [Clostridium perfringens]|uniref:hypothetical protein n=1 Tax=Clostridium perfringens TaxID=1502 RepID=UPI0039EB144E